MSRAFWTVVPAVNTAGRWSPDLPSLPSMTVISPLDINRLPAGAAPADHIHLLVGNVAIVSDQAGGGHEHFVAGGVTILRGAATAHTHADPGGPDFFLCFVRCSDADFVTLVGAPNNVKPLAFATVNADGTLGDMDDALYDNASPTDYLKRSFWATRCLNLFGVALPAAVDRPSRLWKVLAPLFMARRPSDDKGLRGL